MVAPKMPPIAMGTFNPYRDALVRAEEVEAERDHLLVRVDELEKALAKLLVPSHYEYVGPFVADVTGSCLVCGHWWPCENEKARRLVEGKL